MSLYVPVNFTTLTTDETNAPLMVLRDEKGARELRISVSGIDANRLAVTSFQITRASVMDLSNNLIKALGGVLQQVRLEYKDGSFVTCTLVIETQTGIVTSEARSGDGVVLAILNEADIVADESLFFLNQEKPNIKKRIRSINSDSFGSYSFT